MIRLCKHCKHYLCSELGGAYDRCSMVAIHGSTSIFVRGVEASRGFCETARSKSGECGEEGKLFVLREEGKAT